MAETSSQTPEKPLLIAIDGPAGAGKSTVARAVARRLGLPYLDTGAMYRAVGLLARRHGMSLPLSAEAGPAIAELLARHSVTLEVEEDGSRVLLDGEDVSREIRTAESSAWASAVSALSDVRRALVPLQRRIGEERGGVMEGRDIGTVVFPDADLKVFLTAAPDERAGRRLRDLEKLGAPASFEDVRSQQAQRDLQDTSRADSPLQVARGSVVVDTSALSVDQVVERLLAELRNSREIALDRDRDAAIKSRNHGRFEHTAGVLHEEEQS